MDLKRMIFSLATFVVVGCSSDTIETEQEEAIPPVNFIAVGEDAEKVYQFSYDAASDSGQTTDLSAELGIFTNYLTLRQAGDLLSFYSFSGGAFSLAQKNIETGVLANFEDFYANSPGRSVAWGINNGTNVFFGFFGPNGSRNLAIQDVRLDDLETLDVTVDFNIDTVFQPLLFEGKVYFSYRDAQGNNKFTFYNTTTKSVGPLLNFNDVAISFLVTDAGNMAIVKNGTDATLEIYDTDNLTFLESIPLNFDSGFNPGPVEGAVVQNSKLYYAKPFAQPSRFPFGPAIFDLVTQEDNVIDLRDILDSIEQETGEAVGISTQMYSVSRKMFLIGYAILGEEIKGGVLQVSTDGKLVANIQFPFFPAYIVRD